MIKVTVDNNHVDQALRLLKRKLAKSGTLARLKEKAYFQKKSDIERQNRIKIARRNQKPSNPKTSKSVKKSKFMFLRNLPEEQIYYTEKTVNPVDAGSNKT